jgi:hypothetical protein
MGWNGVLLKAVIASFFISSSAFTTSRIHQVAMAKSNVLSGDRSREMRPLLAGSVAFDQKEEEDLAHSTVQISHSPLAQNIRDLTESGKLEEAVQLLKASASQDHDLLAEEKNYQIVLKALFDSKIVDAPEMADELLNDLLRQGFHPSAELFNVVISIWSKSGRKEAKEKCVNYLDDLWSFHAETGDERLIPMRSSYISTMHALSRTFYNKPIQEQAEKAEALLEEMEEKRAMYPQLAPNTIAVNAVL